MAIHKVNAPLPIIPGTITWGRIGITDCCTNAHSVAMPQNIRSVLQAAYNIYNMNIWSGEGNGMAAYTEMVNDGNHYWVYNFSITPVRH